MEANAQTYTISFSGTGLSTVNVQNLFLPSTNYSRPPAVQTGFFFGQPGEVRLREDGKNKNILRFKKVIYLLIKSDNKDNIT